MKEYKHITGAFIGKMGIEIYFQSWLVEKPKGILVISHGLGEHSGRYGNLIERMRGSGVSIFALDHRGHGRSGGNRGHVASFAEYIQDLKVFISQIQDEFGKLPLVLLGHSLGGVIAMKYALTHPEDLKALALSSAGLIPAVAIPGWKKKLGLFFSRYIPTIAMSNELDPVDLSRDSSVVENYKNDPLVHDRVTARWYSEFSAAGEECLLAASELKMPLLLIHGSDDKMVDYRGSERVHTGAASKDKTLHVFPGLYHETMNELPAERSKVLDVVAKWIAGRIKGRKAGTGSKAAAAKPVRKVGRPPVKKAKKDDVKKVSGTVKKKAGPAKSKASDKKAAPARKKAAVSKAKTTARKTAKK